MRAEDGGHRPGNVLDTDGPKEPSLAGIKVQNMSTLRPISLPRAKSIASQPIVSKNTCGSKSSAMATLRVEQGSVRGAVQDGVYSFLGLPYAAPPVGRRRWQPPAPAREWEGVREATSFGHAAVQTIDTGFDIGADTSEDCLYANIWTTDLDPSARQPVMVWIHGGGFLNGAASMKHWTGASLAQRGVVVVSLNYRLGAFGFLMHPQAGGNFAVMDWVAALTWVCKNITSFGGDPNNVTIFGQSAGGAAVRILLATPTARGLFHRGIIQSAGFEHYAAVPSPSHARVAESSEKVFEYLGSRDIDVLRQLPTEMVRAASLAMSGTKPPPGQLHSPANLVWYPVADGKVVTVGFSGWAADVPVMFGCTQDEARAFYRPTGLYGQPGRTPADVYNLDTLSHMAKALAGARCNEVLNHFASCASTPYEALTELSTTAVWLEPALATYQRFAALGRTAYYYIFARASPAARRSGLLAYHSAEIPYIFGPVSRQTAWKPLGEPKSSLVVQQHAPSMDEDFDEIDVEVANATQNAWVDFARTGAPRLSDGMPWPSCTRSDQHFTLIGDSVKAEPLHISPVMKIISALRSNDVA